MAATNYPDRIRDSGVLRRFGVKLYVGLPRRPEDRVELVVAALRGIYGATASNGSCESAELLLQQLMHDAPLRKRLGELTVGYTASEISSIVSYAASGGSSVKPEQLRFAPVPGRDDAFAWTSVHSRDALTADDLEGLFEKARAEHRPPPVVCWPVVSREELLAAFANAESRGFARSVGVDALLKFKRYAENVLLDFSGAREIADTIADLKALQVKRRREVRL